MDLRKYTAEVESKDLTEFKYNTYNNPENISQALLALAFVDKEEPDNKGVVLAPSIYNNVLSAIGNNHSGTYYPVVLEALNFIIAVSLHGNNEISRNCAINILIELFFFSPENVSKELAKVVKMEITKNKENFIYLSCTDEKNRNLLNELVECISEDNVL
ncbi:MAG: hypothetical protein ACRDBO_20020 [Lachnospiraceae bacterium]